MWEAIKEVSKSTSLYYGKVNAFLAILVVAVTVNYAVNNLSLPSAPQAAGDVAVKLSSAATSDHERFTITVDEKGTVVANGEPVKDAITINSDGTQQFLVILIRNPEFYIDKVTATVTLPRISPHANTLQPRIYAIHGVESSNYIVNSANQITFTAESLIEGSEVSIGLTFPKGYFTHSAASQLRNSLATLTPAAWLSIGIIIPGLTLLLFLYLLIKKWGDTAHTNKVSETPPSSLPPSVLGTLYNGRIRKREIAATVFDLAVRGFLTIHQRSNGELAFGKGDKLFTQAVNQLRPFEIFLLHQFFGENTMLTSERKVDENLNHDLFSNRIAMSLVNIYDAAVAEGFFIQSPNKHHIKYKYLGILLFFISLIATIYGAFTLPEPGFVLFFWVGMILMSLGIIWVTPALPHRTPHGDQALTEWLAFRNFLSHSKPIKSQQTSLFFTYLPYALAMDCEKEWMKRWAHEPLVLPDWFSAEKTLYTADDYSASLLTTVNYLTQHLFSARPPDIA